MKAVPQAALRDALAAATETHALEIGAGAIKQVPRLFREQFGESAAVIVADKHTFACPAPTAVVADLDVICAATPEMNAWGYADLLAKVTAGADWLVAEALGAEAIHEQAWGIVQGRLRELVADPAGIKESKVS